MPITAEQARAEIRRRAASTELKRRKQIQSARVIGQEMRTAREIAKEVRIGLKLLNSNM